MNVDLNPRHLQLRDMLFRRWKTNGLKAGDKIESQNEITRFCDFSLITVIKTLKDLETEGIIRRHVGKGSFLVKAPWAEAHHRIGFFYNRNSVGGGIFNNEFYTRLVTALERRVVSDGHEFIMGSFTHDKMPLTLWDRLDMVVLTGVTSRTDITALDQTTSLVSVLDAMVDRPQVECFRLDYRPAMVEMFRRFGSTPNRVLYLDTVHASSEQQARLEALQSAIETARTPQVLNIAKVNQEERVEQTAALEAVVAAFQPDLVCGYLHHSWSAKIAAKLDKPVRIYRFGLDSSRPGFAVNGDDWMASILPIVYQRLENRGQAGELHSFPAQFIP